MSALPAHAARFTRDAGAITWDREALSRCPLEPEVSRILHVAAVLEEDTGISARQARALGVDRAADIAAFLATWEREEAEHARSLRFLLANQVYDPPLPPLALIPLRRRIVALVPATAFRRAPMTGLIYCALGAAAEYVAMVIYTELTKRIEQPAVVSLLRSITRQEGRHFAFLLAAAQTRAEPMSGSQGRLARRVFTSIWEPIGLPSFGERSWRAALAPLLENDDVCARVEMMDRVVDSIPHLGGLKLMETFLHSRDTVSGRPPAIRPQVRRSGFEAGSGRSAGG